VNGIWKDRLNRPEYRILNPFKITTPKIRLLTLEKDVLLWYLPYNFSIRQCRKNSR